MPDAPLPRSTVDVVGRTGLYPMSGPWPPGDARIVGQGQLGHPEQQHLATRPQALRVGRADALTAARLLFGGYFVYSGLNHFLNRPMMTAYARSKHVRWPGAAVLGSGALILLGGLSLLTGVKPRLGAGLVTSFLGAVTPVMHNFWAVDDEQQRMQELVNFTKNIGLIGGAAFAAAVPEPWRAPAPAAIV